MIRNQKLQKGEAKVFVIVPAFNEVENIGAVVSELRALKSVNKGVVESVIVCDNASTDDTAIIAQRNGAVVTHEPTPGYGAACLKAISKLEMLGAKNHDIIVFVDGDHSVKTSELGSLLSAYKSHAGLVIGARDSKLIESGAMGPHQRAGNWMAAKLINYFWGVSITDLGPFRAINYQDLKALDMHDTRFGWTTEMQVKAIQRGMNYTEVPVTTLKREGASKISGTLRGTVGAAFGIFTTVFKFRFNELMQARSIRISSSHKIENSQEFAEK